MKIRTVKMLAVLITFSLNCTVLSAQEGSRVIEDGGTGKIAASGMSYGGLQTLEIAGIPRYRCSAKTS
jgi:hypothetical protein